MIISRISGGIGNQLFQYAAGRALSLKHGTDLKLDIHAFDSEKHRSFELFAFDIKASIAKESDFDLIHFPNPADKRAFARVWRRIFRFFEKIKPYPKRSFIIEQRFAFDPSILKTGPDAYLSGIWQTEKYFKEFEDVIRKDLILRNRPSIVFQNVLDRITSTDSISIHIRRGDYVSNPKANSLHGVCDIEYYQKAITMVLPRTMNPTFFVFADDIEWAKNNLALEHDTVFVSGAGLSNAEELILMSACSHNIIANSTFSWWAAWLNTNPHKTVIAPKNWFKAPHLDTKDLLPESWKRL